MLIFDEVITGFRLAYGGAQQFYQVIPDLTCLGKVIGGGFPVAAYGGRREIMEWVSPLGPVYQAGTLSGNPVAVTAGLATLQALRDGLVYAQLAEKGRLFREGMPALAARAGIPLQVTGVGSLTGIFFTDQAVNDFEGVCRIDSQPYQRFFRSLLQEGILFPPSPFETIFISAVHSNDDLEWTLDGIGRILQGWSGV